jgi:hypothetical protein
LDEVPKLLEKWATKKIVQKKIAWCRDLN